ncbi:MAG: hypothetical protein QXW47_07470 [Candidatus Jordarchaeales archaeon]
MSRSGVSWVSFAASLLGRGNVKMWSKDELNASLLLFGDVLTKLLLLGSILPILWHTDYLPAWYLSAVAGVYHAPFTLTGIMTIQGVQIPVVVTEGYPLPPDLQIYAPHTPWTLISALISSSAFATLVGGLAYSYYAYHKTVETGKDFTAPPFGPSLPAAFLILIGVVAAAQNLLGLDIYTAVSIAITANIACSIIEAIIALIVVERIKGRLPLPGVLGAAAGIGFAWIIVGLFSFAAGTPIGGVYGATGNWPQLSPAIGLIVTVMLLSGLLFKKHSRVPPALAALAIGVILVVASTLYAGSGAGDSYFYFREVWVSVFGGIGPQFLLAYMLGLDPTPYVHLGCFTAMFPSLRLEFLGRGLEALPLILAVVVPIQVYDVVESYANTKACNLELARRIGISSDEIERWTEENGYSPSKIMLIDALASLISVPLGGWVPTVNYVGSAGYVRTGARAGYPVLAGLLLISLTWTGVFYLVPMFLPISVTAPILLFIGGVTVVQAFREVHEANIKEGEKIWGDLFAVCLAMTPQFFSSIASMLALNFSLSLTETPMSMALSPYKLLNDVFYFAYEFDGLILKVPYAKLLGAYGCCVNTTFNYASLITGWSGMLFLGLNASLIGLIWGSIASDLNHERFNRAAKTSIVAAVLSLLGVMHSYSVPLSGLELFSTLPWALAYLAVAALIFFRRRK